MPRLRDITPRGLYARSLLLILAPVLLILGLMIWYYYSSHIAEINRKLGQGLARDAGLIRDACLNPDYGPADLDRIQGLIETQFTCTLPADAVPVSSLRTEFPYNDILRSELITRLGEGALIGRSAGDSRLHVRFPAGTETAEMILDRKRALMINAHFLIVWVIFFSLLLVALSIGFLNQQVRSILRLSEAARAFGRGRDLPDFRPSGATEVRDAARALIDMKARLTAFADQRTAMLAGVSHDLRTPLTRLKLTLALMEDNPDITAAKADLDDMAMMLDEYLAFARGEEGDEPGIVDLGNMVREVCAGFGPHVPVTGPVRMDVPGRPLALKRAVTNLVSNALKYAATARVTLISGPHWAEVMVDDDGPGIPPERYEDAFRPFSRLDDARSQNASGSGLGLTLARDTARVHGGDVRLSPSPLGGLRATLRLPH
ncbi:ATP-binding protein [Hyphomonas sp.]|uniref:ATP-binding protein n=1 Tax=Hyphomonas sp. TaxID=87 RepID=UPI00391AB763